MLVVDEGVVAQHGGALRLVRMGFAVEAGERRHVARACLHGVEA
eukprot:CAMPEP_0183337494 /NCGR_PEP_ID=MMETSP0164_2-20130417/5113_1 /TAXON_ID=221442 /ORGANISM="Coccolithus pelagicus ssp braarudi, Strain PLY182g" /LENGTH=43 /DNA_ID= /DNA_START= /DNA_END= /DNA_ORIENTATION=